MKNCFIKPFMLVALLIASTLGLWSKTINADEAKNIAHQFLVSKAGTTPERMKRVSSSKTSLDLVYEAKAQNGNSQLFVFNQGDNGFVVVAGDDCVSPILGYADAGVFDEGNMPEGFRYWLKSCSRYIEKAKAGEVRHEDMTIKKVQNRSYASYINPLLGDIAFHQQDPYNSQCPTVYGERTIVGCVAISMGQIMTYYQWPKQSQGSYSYTTGTEYLNVSADFNTKYDWANILHNYDNGYNRVQQDAVSKLLFHCGVSVNMDYGVDGSGTSDIYVPKAMAEYFSYDKGMQVHYRAMYSFNDWKNLIKEELNEDRPIIYCGQSEEGGHAFNCDGYDSNDYFHINWGWGGYYNGYYDLRYLDYEDNEQSAYNRSHSIVTGIKPDKGDGTETQTPLAHNLMLTNGANVVDNTFIYALFNMGGGDFVGDIATGIYYKDELVYKYIHAEDILINPVYGYSEVSQDVSDWAMDYYEVQPIYRESGSSEWKPIPGENGMLSRWVYYNGYWTYYLNDIPQLQINSWDVVGDLTSNSSPVFELNITNTNDFDYYGQIFLCISDYNLTSYKTSYYKQITILSGETQTIQIDFGTETFAEGDYYLSAWADMKNGDVVEMRNSDDEYMFPITIGQGSGPSTSAPQLELYNYSSLNKTDFTFGEELEYTAYIYNSGESGYGYLSIDAYNYNGEWLGCIASYDNYYVTSGYNDIVLSGILTENLIPEGDYYVRIWWSDNNNSFGHIEPDYYNAIAFSVKKEESYSYQFELVGDMQLNKTTFDRGETIEATYTIRNNGDSRYLNLGIAIADLYENSSYTNLANTTQVYFPAYSDREITSTVVVPSDFEYGEYRIFAYYHNDWDDTGYKFFIPIEFNAKHITVEEGIRQPELEMVVPIELNKTSFYPGETIAASFTLKNIGYDGYVNVGLTMTNGDSDFWHPELGDDMQNVYLSANSTKELNFTIDIPRNYAAGTYSVIAYQEVEGWYYNIDPTDNSVVLISVEEHDGKYDIFVTSNGDGEVVGAGRYEYGSEAIIAAIPDYGYKFYRWSDKNKENPRVVTVEGEATYEAEFRAITLSLEAQPNDDAFEFVEWSDGETDNPRTISIAEESELKYVAIFRMKETAIENAYITSAHVYSNSGNLYVVGAEGDYLVFDEVGKLIYSGNENSIQLPSGAYLVRLGKEVQKVIVK